MDTISELTKYITSNYKQLSLSPGEEKAECELLLSFLTNLSLAERLKNPEFIIKTNIFEKAKNILERRLKHEPIQYCLGQAYFYGLELKIRPPVLIPRSDTETLVEITLSLAKKYSWTNLAEIGIGSGAISIALLKHLSSQTKIEACDIDDICCELSFENAKIHALEKQLKISNSDWKPWLASIDIETEAIISNPPYIAEREKYKLNPEVKDWESPLALFGSELDGLGFYRNLVSEIYTLSPKLKSIWLILEFGDHQTEKILEIFKGPAWKNVHIHKDLSGMDRVLSVEFCSIS